MTSIPLSTASAGRASRRPWIAPVLTRHASLTALTQVQYQQPDPYFNEVGEPIPCSQGFCP